MGLARGSEQLSSDSQGCGELGGVREVLVEFSVGAGVVQRPWKMDEAGDD